MRPTILAFSLLGSAQLMIGCGDSSSTSPDAARDAAIDAPAPFFKGFMADEGGEVKLEYMLFPNGNIGGRVQRFVLKNSGAVPYHPLPTLNACTNVDKGQGKFPTAQNADRVYADPGLVLISNPTGATPTMTLVPNTAAGGDSVGRMHPAGMYTVADAAGGPFVGGTSTSGTTYFTERTLYDVTFTGSADLPAQTFKGALWMPANVTLVNPPLGTFVLQAGVDQQITMSPPAAQTGKPDETEVRELAAFTGPNGLSVFCIDELKDNIVTVTAAAADIIRAKYPTGGSMARMNLTHIVRELHDHNGPTGRRVDFISNWCNATPFSVP